MATGRNPHPHPNPNPNLKPNPKPKPKPNPDPNPSPNPNQVSIFDADRVGARDFIGATTIDLENRWFNSEWRDMALKPVEMRTLRTPLSKMSQGKVELWVEMMTPEEARQVPMLDIKPPPPEEFELRVIVWKTEVRP